jgi:hypothetical protein
MKVLVDELTTKNETLNKELDEKNKEVNIKYSQMKFIIVFIKIINPQLSSVYFNNDCISFL